MIGPLLLILVIIRDKQNSVKSKTKKKKKEEKERKEESEDKCIKIIRGQPQTRYLLKFTPVEIMSLNSLLIKYYKLK